MVYLAMTCHSCFWLLWILYWKLDITFAETRALTLIVAEGSRECFYETVDMHRHTGQIHFEFEVTDGGVRDIEAEVTDPDFKVHFRGERRRWGSFNVTLVNSGLVEVCFSNQFSLLTPKQVYFELEIDEKTTPLMLDFFNSELILTTERTEKYLRHASILQKVIYRRSLPNYRKAVDLNFRVQLTIGMMTLGMLVISVGQVVMLKRLFADKSKPFIKQRTLPVPPPPPNHNAFGHLTIN